MAEQIKYPAGAKLPVTDNGNGLQFPALMQERDIDNDGTLEYEPYLPIVNYERQLSTGLYLPPGVIQDDSDVSKPRMRIPEVEDKIGEVNDSPTAYTLLSRIKELETKLGEVKDAPTANTLLARMKELEDKLDSIINDGLDVKQVGSIVELSTAINAQSISAGGNTGTVSMGLTGEEKEVWVYVQIDQQPWSCYASTPYSSVVGGSLYPKLTGITTTHTNTTPASALYLSNRADSTTLINSPANFQEARNISTPPLSNSTVYMKNDSANIATVTVKILKIYR